MPMKPAMLPSMRTPKKAIPAAKMPDIRMMAMSALLATVLPSSKVLVTGAARSRFQSPRRRVSSKPMPTSMPMNMMNCTLIPAKECE